MRTQFQWIHERMDNDDVPTANGRFVVLDTRARRVESRRPSCLRIMVLVAALLAVCAVGVVKVGAQRGAQTAQADLAAVVRMEAKALAQGDGDLYRSLYAPLSGQVPALSGERYAIEQAALANMDVPPDSRPRLLNLTLTDEWADVWVGYTSDGTTYARLQSYRRVGGRWLRTDPNEGVWGEALTLQTAHFMFRFHASEERVVGLLAQWAEALYANLDFGSERPSGLITIELHPYLAQPSFHTEPPSVAFTSPLLLSIRPESWRCLLRLADLRGLAYAPGEGQEVLSDLATLGRPVAEALSYPLALLLAGSAIGEDLSAPELHWPIVEAVVRYAVERQVPGLTADEQDRALLQASVNEGRLLPLDALWRKAVVVESQEGCDNLQIASQAQRHTGTSSAAEVWSPCFAGSDEHFLLAVVEAKSLVAFAAERVWGNEAEVPGDALPARLLVAVAFADTPEAAIRRLFQEGAQNAGASQGDATLPGLDPQQSVAAWQAWLAERYG